MLLDWFFLSVGKKSGEEGGTKDDMEIRVHGSSAGTGAVKDRGCWKANNTAKLMQTSNSAVAVSTCLPVSAPFVLYSRAQGWDVEGIERLTYGFAVICFHSDFVMSLHCCTKDIRVRTTQLAGATPPVLEFRGIQGLPYKNPQWNPQRSFPPPLLIVNRLARSPATAPLIPLQIISI